MNRRTAERVGAFVAVVVLVAASFVAVVALRGGSGRGRGMSVASCQPPHPVGAVVQVTFTDSGGMMMGGQGAVDRLTVAAGSVVGGRVTLVATNIGALAHELLIMPMPADGSGTRPVGRDGKVDESANKGEASTACGSGIGDGISPGSRGWTTVTLQPGTYELLCDVPWHYASGMFTTLRVT